MKIKNALLAAVLVTLIPASAFAASDAPNWNISTNPLGLIVGPNLRLEYKTSDHWTWGPSASLVYINVSDVKINGFSVGVDAKYYFNQAFVEHGWWVDGGVSYGGVKAKYKDSKDVENNADVRTASLRGLGGYQWFWGNFNLSLGAGLSLNYYSSREITDNSGNKVKDIPYVPVGLSGDASIGWTF